MTIKIEAAQRLMATAPVTSKKAIDELRKTFPDKTARTRKADNGGYYMTFDGPGAPVQTWLKTNGYTKFNDPNNSGEVYINKKTKEVLVWNEDGDGEGMLMIDDIKNFK